jgi:protein-L-isoaspartate O-methyltransferase
MSAPKESTVRSTVPTVFQKVLRTPTAWRLTGLTWWTATVATRGRYLSTEEYLADSRTLVNRMHGLLQPHFTVLEFGCGIGGNLITISPQIDHGIGLDINRGFVRIAQRLARRCRARNVEFLAYDGSKFPKLPPFDLIFSLGVFERIPKTIVDSYISRFQALLKPGGSVVLFFLHSGAVAAGVTRRLGSGAFVFWTREEVAGLMQRHGYVSCKLDDWFSNGRSVAYTCYASKQAS